MVLFFSPWTLYLQYSETQWKSPIRFLLDLVETRIVLTFGSPTVKENHIFVATLVRLAVCQRAMFSLH